MRNLHPWWLDFILGVVIKFDDVLDFFYGYSWKSIAYFWFFKPWILKFFSFLNLNFQFFLLFSIFNCIISWFAWLIILRSLITHWILIPITFIILSIFLVLLIIFLILIRCVIPILCLIINWIETFIILGFLCFWLINLNIDFQFQIVDLLLLGSIVF